jgi:hypothetical protein
MGREYEILPNFFTSKLKSAESQTILEPPEFLGSPTLSKPP